MAKRSWPESMRNAALLGLMQPNLETHGARRTGRYTLFGLAVGNFREIGRCVWNLCDEGILSQDRSSSWFSCLKNDQRKFFEIYRSLLKQLS